MLKLASTFLLLFYVTFLPAKPFVTADLMGQFGNQLFQIAAATSLALDNQAKPLFPNLLEPSDPLLKFKENYETIFFRLSTKLLPKALNFTYYEPKFSYQPISYQPNMKIHGYFQSEKYFAKHRNKIVKLFKPSKKIKRYLKKHYGAILAHPKTVAVHYRSYLQEDPEQNHHNTLPLAYFEKAIALFPADSLFVVCSNKINWCKENFASIPRNFVFIEGENHYHDFFLMSACKKHIISNSSFSWWSAYLSPSRKKSVVAPAHWFNPSYISDTQDLYPKKWTILSLD